MAALYVGQITAVQSKSFRQLDLRPATALPQAPKSLPKSNPDVLGHLGDIMAFHEKAGRRQAESLSIPMYKQGFSPPS